VNEVRRFLRDLPQVGDVALASIVDSLFFSGETATAEPVLVEEPELAPAAEAVASRQPGELKRRA
jgi:hypothetical protein